VAVRCPSQAKAAVANGADAIYLGLSDFNARARACNFDPGDELVELMRFLHENGVKGCVCVSGYTAGS
jgi:putative protease